MRRLKIPGLVDVIQVNDPSEIKALAHDPRVDRDFETSTCPFNWLLLKRSLMVLSFGGRLFPTILPREDATRAQRQRELWSLLSEKAATMKTGPDDLEPLANWVRGVGSEAQLGILVQQLLGNLFSDHFVATQETWEAAEVLVAAPRSRNLAKMLWWFVTGKVRRSKRVLAGMVDGNLSAVNAIGIAVHNVVKSIRHLRLLHSEAAVGAHLSAEAAAEQSLFAPVSVYRRATASGQMNGCSFSRNSLFVLAIGKASQRVEGRSLVFMDESWSRCPANLWIPAVLQGIWRRVRMSAGEM